jgi:thiamine pyrophosphokinase
VARAAVIVIGGGAPDPRVVGRVPVDALVIAADSGFDQAVALGLPVHHLVGDLDSISASGLARAEALGVRIARYPVEKDATDAELAIDTALDHGATHLIAISGGAGSDDVRFDHELAALLALAHPRLADRRVEAWWGRAHVRVVHGPGVTELVGPRGTIVSLLPVHGSARGVTTAGLRYPLDGETLDAGSSRGVSNELLHEPATARLDVGTLLVVEPFALGGPP